MKLTEQQYKKLLLLWQIITIASFVSGYALSEWIQLKQTTNKAQHIINEMREEGIICPCNQFIYYNQSNDYIDLKYPLFLNKT